MFHAFFQFSLGILFALSQRVVGRERLTLLWSIKVVLIQLSERKKLKGVGLRSASCTAPHLEPNPRQSPTPPKQGKKNKMRKHNQPPKRHVSDYLPKEDLGVSVAAPGLGCGRFVEQGKCGCNGVLHFSLRGVASVESFSPPTSYLCGPLALGSPHLLHLTLA